MQLSDLQKTGGFVDTRLVKKTATWERFDDKTDKEVSSEVSFFVRRAGYLEVKQAAPVEGVPDGALDPDAMMIASCIRLGTEGDEVIPYSDVLRLEPNLYRIFMGAIGEVYGSATADPKRSPPKKSSGASSSKRASAGARSKKPSKTSASTKR